MHESADANPTRRHALSPQVVARGRYPIHINAPPSDAVEQDHLQEIRRTDPAWLSQVLGLRVEGFEVDVIGARSPSSSDDPGAASVDGFVIQEAHGTTCSGTAGGPLQRP